MLSSRGSELRINSLKDGGSMSGAGSWVSCAGTKSGLEAGGNSGAGAWRDSVRVP